MNIEWELIKTDKPGGAWIMNRRVVQQNVVGDPDHPETVQIKRTVTGERQEAFTTLANARRSIAAELRLDKRVRLRKQSDSQYNYSFSPTA